MGEVIVVTSGKGGVGKTTTTANLGSALALRGKKVVLIDTDIGLRNLDVVMGLENRIVYDIVDVVEEKCKLKQALIKDKRFKDLFLLPAAQTRDKSAVNEEQMKELTEKLKEEFDYIIIDNSPFKSYLTSCAMCASDKIITPICVDNFSYDGLMSLFDTIEELNDKYALSIEFAGIFMTRVAGRTTLFRQMYESYENMFGDRFLPISIRNCIAVNESNTTFEPLLSYDKKCPASLDYVELVNYLGLMDTAHYRKLARYLKGEK